MKKINIETGVGIFLIIGFLCLAYLSVQLGDVHIFGSDHYTLIARFANISGLKEGAVAEIAGVEVGKVSKIHLDDYEALVEIMINKDVQLQDDAIASIRTKGIIGEKYIKILPGGSDEFIMPGEEISETESTLELEELVSKYIFNKE
jgi:phospholipid/cholesterol/gamma-HCH transport system substrate-binding protein